MPDFLLMAILAGFCVTLVTGPLGCFTVWRRMAYFGDTLAHSALLGVSFGWLLSINLNLAVACGCLVLAMVLIFLQQQRVLATDTLLGILSHSTLALGLVIASQLENARIDITSYLFGDLLSVSIADVITMAVVSGIVLSLLLALWRQLITLTVHEDLAQVEGVNVKAVRTVLMLSMALMIAIAMKVVGVILITALLIIPAAAARRVSSTPEIMAVMASLFGMMAIVMGLGASFYWDTPAGPSIVLGTSIIFILTLFKKVVLSKSSA
ncbi:zinc ABC transporter permease subunit ZnuB [Marinibactrum halimedae]|uniref:High-affinity zinc uptake system membrane protein ZnuB n=1 Tax=Marinibactrum halimedae TaxID=1444977 RepID=A0AA37T393_9GAMM|nr:zinc ABC transporter permease subunit ZnuB [Marinibactrum halimedae]MCD9460911.1 zinc ABC transporter permease subunit ZnuB [Marinibactrum halimedae]GLS24586.1 zinc transporter [Marinibactrum halimedae]